MIFTTVTAYVKMEEGKLLIPLRTITVLLKTKSFSLKIFQFRGLLIPEKGLVMSSFLTMKNLKVENLKKLKKETTKLKVALCKIRMDLECQTERLLRAKDRSMLG